MEYLDSPQTSPDSDIERLEDDREQEATINAERNSDNHFNEQNDADDDIEMLELNNDLNDIFENGIEENHEIYQNGFEHSNTNGFGGNDGVNGDDINDDSDIERVMTPLRPRLSDNEYEDSDSDESAYNVEEDEADKVEVEVVKKEQNDADKDKVENGKEG
uniref:Uncharacterized protein n=1 Tax=Panagrolaimus sp. ES5 TaxID=591445 RepID=A0AC34GF69_9BILA